MIYNSKLLSSNTKTSQIFILVSLISSLVGFYYYELSLTTVFLIILGYFLYGCLGIVVTFHRKLTHNSYNTYEILTKIFSIFGCFAGTGSSLSWAAIHLNHHINSDTSKDPHSPLHKGLKIFFLNYEDNIKSNTKWKIKKLINDPFHKFLHRYYIIILLSWSLFLYLIGGFYLVIFFHLFPAVITALMSNVVNYIGHNPSQFGSFRSYNLNDRSTNNWVWAIPSWGETWHNNHHRFPKSFSTGREWWQIDISAIVIRLIKNK